jgi:hypothetical protein
MISVWRVLWTARCGLRTAIIKNKNCLKSELLDQGRKNKESTDSSELRGGAETDES